MLPLPGALPLPLPTSSTSLPLPLPKAALPLPGAGLMLPAPKPAGRTTKVAVLGVEDMPNYAKLKLWGLAETSLRNDPRMQGAGPGERIRLIGARLEEIWDDLQKTRLPLPLPR